MCCNWQNLNSVFLLIVVLTINIFCSMLSRSDDIWKCDVTISLQALQYGDGERKRDVDWSTKNWQRQKEIQTCQQGPIHLQDVPPWRFRHSCPAKPSSSLNGLNFREFYCVTLNLSVQIKLGCDTRVNWSTYCCCLIQCCSIVVNSVEINRYVLCDITQALLVVNLFYTIELSLHVLEWTSAINQI